MQFFTQRRLMRVKPVKGVFEADFSIQYFVS
jgi:hypothetical protein